MISFTYRLLFQVLLFMANYRDLQKMLRTNKKENNKNSDENLMINR